MDTSHTAEQRKKFLLAIASGKLLSPIATNPEERARYEQALREVEREYNHSIDASRKAE